MRITHIRAENFRCIESVDLELRPFNVVIGPNGAGKSSLLELMNIFASIPKPGIASLFARWGGYSATVRYAAPEPMLKVGISGRTNANSFDLEVELFGEGPAFFVRAERLKLQSDSSNGEMVSFDREDDVASFQVLQQKTRTNVGHSTEIAFPRILQSRPDIQKVLNTCMSSSIWKIHKFRPEGSVRGPQQLQPTTIPSEDGANLYSALYSMKTERRESFRRLVADLQTAVPELEELDFPLAGAGHVNLTWKQKDVSQVLYSNQLSDGTLRMIWLLTLLHSLPDDGLALIDEPELSLHPEWVMLITSVLRKMSARMTIVAATQSAELVRWLEPSELIIADVSDEGARFTRADQRNDLDKWLEDFTLAQLWTMGELGGRR